jgi:AP-1 complex subunit beta-1
MTSGRDVSWIFSDVVKCIYTKDLELKKLIYLYLVTYARTQPETSILAVNYFLKDAENVDSSIFRGIAIRTMSAIPLQQMAEYLVEPLTKAMKDSDPYVKKVAALAAAKLHEISPEACANNGVLQILSDMATDQNQAVVANAIAAIMDIARRTGQKPNLTENIYSCVMAAIAECNEWGLVQLLETIPFIVPTDQYMAISALEKISTKLQHANAAVVINSIRAILHLIKYVEEDTRLQYVRRITPSFITLLSTESTEV